MKKKLIVFSVFFSFIFLFAGCFPTSSTEYSDKNVNYEVTDNIDTSSTMPKSTNSIYQSPISLPNNATPTQIANAYIDSVVTIYVINSNNKQVSQGSGVCVYGGGYILTNNHVIDDVLSYSNYKLQVYLNNGKVPYYAEVLWTNDNLDVAIIQCENGDIPYVKIKDRLFSDTEKIQLLEQVIAIGTPLEFSYQNTCTLGYISGLNRTSISSSNVYEYLIQHTASISNGNSGGPLFDMNGNLIGLNTLGAEAGNDLYFAVSIYSVTLILDEVIELNEAQTRTTFKSGKLGVNLTDSIISDKYNQNIINRDGLYITSVGSSSVLLVGDIITSLKIKNVNYTTNCRDDFIYAMLRSSVGDVVEVSIIRNSISTTVNVTII